MELSTPSSDGAATPFSCTFLACSRCSCPCRPGG